MGDYTLRIELPDHKLGDKWIGIASIDPYRSSTPPEAALARVRMDLVLGDGTRFRLDSDASASPDAPIVITDAAAWTAVIPAVPSFVPKAGIWKWDIEFFADGETAPLTFYKGVIEVHEDITKPLA
jgi:hypothetical protein